MRRIYSLISIGVIGFLFGVMLMNLFHMHTLDRLYRIQNQLANQVIDKDIKLKGLNASIKESNTLFIKDIEIKLDFEGNLLFKDMIEENIRFFIADLVGKELSQIDGQMLYKILNSRIIEIEDKNVKLTIKYLIIAETIEISIAATVINS
ncbi:hypothetical protein F8154_02140 [Alkaliphilus pronyensis]|uniref:Sporulation membrane protein YtrI C-terminal domain-containing protein n=1 Tax=Alkaliphilus pronyensis TaxID=1482732 RepID=A0A6I0F4G1_9FIRM|nr:hypothetical protein [Alkaliphilus pronyensis]KAB3537801.1 hypothetical protein F8154_02140 [Alkaliphilus pronyensis]